MRLSQLLFSFKGSISRIEYLAGICISMVIFATLISLPKLIFGVGRWIKEI